jgi:hypothetical protein
MNGLQKVAKRWNVKEMLLQELREPTKMLKKYGIWCITYQSYGCATEFRKESTKKRIELWSNEWILRHGNAPAHEALSVNQLLVQNLLQKWNTHSITLIELQMTSDNFQKQSLP